MRKQLTHFFAGTWKRRVLWGIILLMLVWSVIYFISFDDSILRGQEVSTTFFDRSGNPLRTSFSPDETYAGIVPPADVSPHFLRAIVLIEDRHFYQHHGIVFSSLLRAMWQNITGGRVVSGGSTITMQTVKLLYRHKSRNLFNKLAEIPAALKFEMHLDKSRILEAYINRLPFGNMVYGIKEAARFYFGTEPSQLSLNQAIYLALIPKSPSRYNPMKHRETLEKRRAFILETFKQKKYISRDEYRRAKNEGVTFQAIRSPFLAPHFIEQVKNRFAGKTLPEEIHTTLDYSLQQKTEGIIREHMVRLSSYDVSAAAAVVLDNRTHQVAVLVGSPHFFDQDNAGRVNLAVALRQPGSTLKPFVFGLALEKGYTTASILPDIKFPATGGFFPHNHDGMEHGPLRLRIALACSYNIPTFFLAIKLTPTLLLEKLNRAGFVSLRREPEYYGETIALGSGEVRLLDLVTAYSSFATGGVIYRPAMYKGEAITSVTLWDEQTAFLIWDILADASARFASFGYASSMKLPFPVAVKTGTSKGFRDSWAVAVNTNFTIGVWMGNPDGKNMQNTADVGSASTIVRDIFLAAQKDWTQGAVPVPAGIMKKSVCPLSGELLSPFCPDTVEEVFIEGREPEKTCDWHFLRNGTVAVRYPEMYKTWALKNNTADNTTVRTDERKKITFPQQGDFFYISDAVSRQDQQITFEAGGFEAGEKLSWYLDGNAFGDVIFPAAPIWSLTRGNHSLELRSNSTILDKVEFIVR